MNKKLIIFDMDGVLFNSEKLAHEHLKKSFPNITDEMHKELLSGNFHEEMKKIAHMKVQFTDEEKKKIKKDYADKKAKVPLCVGIKDLLIFLNTNNYKIALNTSAYERNTFPMLKNAEILEMFDFLGTAEISKSKIEKFKIMEEKYGLKNEEVLFVTDTLGDLREAEMAGVPTVCVTWGAHDRGFFTREEHKNLVGIIDKVEEIKEFI